MKIRIKGNSIRWRLSKLDVAMLCKIGVVEDQTNLIESSLTFSIRAGDGISEMSVKFVNSRMELLVPVHWLADWEQNDKIGFANNIQVPGGELQLLLEKDFKCMDATGEDQSGNYDRPRELAQK